MAAFATASADDNRHRAGPTQERDKNNSGTALTISTAGPIDIGRFKGPTLRALTARAPYFHNAFAKDLSEVVKFYNDRFNIGFTEQEKEYLIAFLKAL